MEVRKKILSHYSYCCFSKISALKVLKNTLLILLLCVFAPAFVNAQNNPFSNWNKIAYQQIKGILLRSAEKMPEEHYQFKPTETVRSFGQIIGHVADSQYTFCSIVRGEKNPLPQIEKNKTAKSDLIAALKESFVYCDKAYKEMKDSDANQTVKMLGMEMPKPYVLITNNTHSIEHYGNLVTYLRLKNIIPPTSEAGFTPQP